MNREDIIKLAREAGAIPIHKDYSQKALVGNENIERFFQAAYAKGQADEREACAKVCDGLTDEEIVTLFNKTLDGKPLDVNSMTNFARAIEAAHGITKE